MPKSPLDDMESLLALCRESKSFSVVLLELLDDNDTPQKKLAELLNYSVAHVNRIANEQLPDNMHINDVRRIAEALHCSEQEWARLALAFSCYFLSKKGLLGSGGTT